MRPAGGEVSGPTPFPGDPRRPAGPQEAFHHGPEPWESVARGGGCVFPPGASIPCSPGGESAWGQVAVLGAETSCCRAQAPDLQWASPHT